MQIVGRGDLRFMRLQELVVKAVNGVDLYIRGDSEVLGPGPSAFSA